MLFLDLDLVRDCFSASLGSSLYFGLCILVAVSVADRASRGSNRPYQLLPTMLMPLASASR